MKTKIAIIFILILIFILSSCSGNNSQDMAIAIALTQTAASQPVIMPSSTPAETNAPVGLITGTAHYQAPPTPAMTIYAVNLETDEWFKAETAASDTVATFSIQVVPGYYMVFSQGIGYESEDGWSLGTVTVGDGQTVANIDVRPPSQSDCGSMFAVPAAPDGSFGPSEGPDPDCKANLLSGAASALMPDSATSSLMRISFNAGSTMAQVPGTIADANGGHHYILGAAKNQTMTINLLTSADAYLVIWGNNGTTLLSDSSRSKSWSGVLPATQDYYIDIRSISLSPVDYTLEAYITALNDAGSSSSQGSTEVKTGNIYGSLNYPDSYIPPMHIVAFNQDTGYWFWQGTAEGASSYTMVDLPAGKYTIVAYTQNGLIGSYASIGDGDVIPFEVKGGQVVTVDMTMWLDRNNPHFPASSDPVNW